MTGGGGSRGPAEGESRTARNVGVGCFATFVGLWSGAMVGVLVAKYVGAGISASTLSVEISKIGSSRLTASPTFFSHLESVPSAIDSPIWGMTTSMRATGSSSR